MSAPSRVLAPIVVALALASVAAPACAPAGSSGAGAPAAGGLPDRDPALACKLVRERGALLLDVRSDEEFAAGHLEGALHVPHDQLASRLDEVGVDGLVLFNRFYQPDIDLETLLAPDIRELVFSKRLAQSAADLMQTSGVRLYHDQALFKEAGGGITPWHADQFYWPLETDRTVTAWIPLQHTPLEMGPLEFSAGSHRIVAGRELAISDESEQKIGEKLRVTDFAHIVEPFDAGEVSFPPCRSQYNRPDTQSDDRDLHG